MFRQTPFSIEETYHVYNRGAHKQNVFISDADYQRFLILLFVMNDPSPLEMRRLLEKYGGRSSAIIFEEEKPSKSLVDIMAYSLMPNHFHIVVRQKAEQGITRFFKKVLTGYSMYFNTKYEHSGVLFQGRFKSKHVNNEPYFRYIFSYVHLNPLSLIEPGWEEKGIKDKDGVRNFMRNFPYSSYQDYAYPKRPELRILAENDIPEFLTTHNDLEDLLTSLAED